MKSIIFIVIGILLVGAFLYFGRGFIPQLASSQGEIRVESQPETTVFIDGETMGKTPYSKKLDPEQYEIKLLPEDQASVSTWQQSITVNPGTQTYIRVQLGDSSVTSSWEIITLEKLETDETEIAVSSETEGAEIYFDGDFKGTVPLSFDSIDSGKHEIRLTAPGFAERKITVEVTNGYKLTVKTQLALVDESKIQEEEDSKDQENSASSQQMVLIDSPDTGWLRVRSEPSKSGEELARVDDREEYPLISEENGWYEIEYEDGETGWISGSYAQEVEESDGDQESSDENEEEEENE